MEKVKLAGRLRAIASDVEQGAQEGPARMLRQVADVLDQEADALEELRVAATAWASAKTPRATQRAADAMLDALDHLERVRSQR